MMAQKISNRTVPAKLTSSSTILSQDKIIKLLIYAIQEYKKHKITLNALTTLTQMILKDKNLTTTEGLKRELEEINSFTVVDNILNDILYELKHKEL